VVFPMTRYFFHVRRGRLIILDHCGVELADFAEAAKEAVRRALKMDETSAAVSESKDVVLVDDGFSTILEVPLTGLRNEPRSVPLP